MCRHNKITADKTPVRDIETRGRYVENQTKKLESKEKITYNRENIERNNIKNSTEKNGINIGVPIFKKAQQMKWQDLHPNQS